MFFFDLDLSTNEYAIKEKIFSCIHLWYQASPVSRTEYRLVAFSFKGLIDILPLFKLKMEGHTINIVVIAA